MCNMVTQRLAAKDLKVHLNAKQAEQLPLEYTSNFYKADGFKHPDLLITLERKGERIVDTYQWGLMANWNKPLDEMLKIAKGTLNARSEEIRKKPSYKDAIKNQRCILPVNSFFEYKHVGSDTLPYLIQPKEQPYFYLAGLYSFYKDQSTNEWYKTFTILTEPANTFMANIHNSAKRMPLMLSADLIDPWLDPNSPESVVDEIMKFACDDSTLSAFRVRRELKKMDNTAEVLSPVGD